MTGSIQKKFFSRKFRENLILSQTAINIQVIIIVAGPMNKLMYCKKAQAIIEKLNAGRHKSNYQKFPLQLMDNHKSPKEIPFYSKFATSKNFRRLFEETIMNLTQKNSESTMRICHIQPKLRQKMKESLSLSGLALDLQSLQIKRMEVIDELTVKGVFIHRQLNMPSNCYSVQKVMEKDERKNKLIYRVREKIQREAFLSAWNQKKRIYEGEEHRYYQYYMDGFQNFMKSEEIQRKLVLVDAKLKGRLLTREGTCLSLPVDQQKSISCHLLQLQTANIAGQLESEKYLVSDIDFFMGGNPHVIG